jgi:hypothetical protein
MFLFKTEVKVATDPRMGLGLFATEFIPKCQDLVFMLKQRLAS